MFLCEVFFCDLMIPCEFCPGGFVAISHRISAASNNLGQCSSARDQNIKQGRRRKVY